MGWLEERCQIAIITGIIYQGPPLEFCSFTLTSDIYRSLYNEELILATEAMCRNGCTKS